MRSQFVLLLIFSSSVFACYKHVVSKVVDTPPADLAPEMIAIPAGSFIMGDINGAPAESPERNIDISAFLMDVREVSWKDYQVCVVANICQKPSFAPKADVTEMHPVVGVSWNDADTFCKWLGRRLPTEAEWEYAAKGYDNKKWPWGNKFDSSLANTRTGDSYEFTAPVTAFEKGKSVFGVMNMAGNVAEWVSDYFDPILYRREPTAIDPQGPKSGREKVVRGGHWSNESHLVRVSARVARLPTDVDDSVGFRCAKSQ